MQRNTLLQTACLCIAMLVLASCGSKKASSKVSPVVKPIEIAKADTIKIEAPKPWVAPVKHEMRAVWLTTIYGLDWPQRPASSRAAEAAQRNALCKILDRLQEQKYNTVFFQVRHRGDVIYPSRYEAMSSVFTGSTSGPAYDPLDFAIRECHKRGLSFHAWLVVTPLGPDKHVRSLNGRSPKSRHPEFCVKHSNLWYLNPGEPAARKYFASLVDELVSKYPVDGIHLDYMRYPEKAASFNDKKSYERYGKGMDLMQWRRRNLSDMMIDIHRAATRYSPWVQVSVATLGRLKALPGETRGASWTAYNAVYQDPVTWSKEKSVDFIVPMMYYRDGLFDPYLLDWKAQLPDLPIVPGLGVYRVDDESQWEPSVISRQIDLVREQEFAGICFFREEHTRNGRRSRLGETIKEKFKDDVVAHFIPRGFNKIPPAPTAAKLLRAENGEQSIYWDMPSELSDPVSYRLYLSYKDASGKQHQQLLADDIKDCHYTIPSSSLAGKQSVELRIQAVNLWGVCGAASMPIKGL